MSQGESAPDAFLKGSCDRRRQTEGCVISEWDLPNIECLPRCQYMFDYIQNLDLAQVSGIHSKNQEESKMFLP